MTPNHNPAQQDGFMNRLALLEPPAIHTPSVAPGSPLREFERSPDASPFDEGDDYIASLSPINYEQGYAYPLFVWLHGAGGNERHLQDVMPHISLRNYAAVAVRGPAELSPGEGFSWGDGEEHIHSATERILQAVELAHARFHIHPRRIFVAGHGLGGTMAIRTAWRFPEMFAGAASLAGGIHSGHRPLRNLNRMRRLPLFLASGVDGTHYSEQHVCRDLRLLHSAGAVVSARQYPSGDELRTPMLNDLNRWMMDIVCQNAVAVTA